MSKLKIEEIDTDVWYELYDGKPSVDNAVICSKETYGSDIINDIAYVI